MDTADEKLGISFHRSFPLSRDMLRQVLATACSASELTYKGIRAETTLGTVQVQATRRYGIGGGLFDWQEELTPWGRLVTERDANLSTLATQWILHYHLSAPHRNGPAFWNDLVLNCLRPGDTLTTSDVAAQIERFHREQGNSPLVERTYRSTATIFLGTYSKPDALGGLGFLTAIERETYRVSDPVPVEAPVFAYVLADTWRARWQQLHTANLSDVLDQDGPAPLLFLGSGEINSLLREMQIAGEVQLQRRIPPYQVGRLWDTPETLLERVYV